MVMYFLHGGWTWLYVFFTCYTSHLVSHTWIESCPNYLSKYTDISRLWILIQGIPKHINLRSILPYMESKLAMMFKYTFMYFMFWCMYEKHIQKILPLWRDACPKVHLWHSHTRLDLLRICWESTKPYPSAFPSHHLLVLQTTHQVKTLEFEE
jgi:cellulose synthase/poly-beta-1,6-N-acetylglucosamine synthase-like glycosyltransferase